MRKRIAAALLALLALTVPAFAAFDDVSDTLDRVFWAESEGVMNGVSADSFGPYGAVHARDGRHDALTAWQARPPYPAGIWAIHTPT